MEPLKIEADIKLLSGLLGYEPLNCARRPNGDLVYLNQAGQKFILTPAEIDKLIHKKRDDRSCLQEQGTEIPETKHLQAAESEKIKKPRSHHKKVLDPIVKEGDDT